MPRWKVLVIDENFLPGKDVPLEQQLGNPYFGSQTVYSASTDKNGFAVFPARYRWAGIVRRVFAGFWTLFGYETGTSVRISVAGERCRGAVITWNTGKGSELPDKLVCQE